MNDILDPARKLLALAQSGLHFTKDPYDRDRYEEVAQLAAQLLASQVQSPGLDADSLLEIWRRDKGYATPKIEVRGAVFRQEQGEDRVLLVRETIDGKWTLPGGWADINEGPRQAIEKEILQESGYVATAAKLAAVYDKRQHAHPPSLFHTWKLFFICDITGGAPSHSLETDGVDFFPLDRLPELSLPRTVPAQIERMRVHHYNRQLTTEFD